MAEELLRKTFRIQGRDFEKAGEASTEIKALLKGLGIDPAVIRRAVVVTFEAEMNVVIHARKGTVTLMLTDEDLHIEIADEGPGIPDIAMAMQEGFSTASDEMRQMGFGFGMGLPNIKKNSDVMNLKSEPGRGTVVDSRIFLDGHG